MTPRLTEEVADYVVARAGARPAAVARARRAFLDTIAVAVAGRASAAGERMLAYVGESGGRPVAGVLGQDARTTPELAALCNGTLAHALDFDDTNHVLEGHSSAHLVPAALAAGQAAGATLGECLEAYLAGHQVESALARGLNPRHFRFGFHPTATIATLGAAAAAARVRGLGREETVNALAIAASAAAGLRANVGTMTKPLHAGQAAAAAVRAAALAGLGWDGSREALEGTYGFVPTHAGGEPPRYDEMLAALHGEPIVLMGSAHVLKPFPCCAASHPAIEAALQVRARAAARRIARVTVAVGEVLPTVLVHDRPRTGNEARFSLRYTVARALASGRVAMRDFAPAALAEPDVRALMDLVETEPSGADLGPYGVTVRVRLADGAELEATVPDERVQARPPMTDERLWAKVADCVGGEAPARALWDAVLDGDAEGPVERILEAAAGQTDAATTHG